MTWRVETNVLTVKHFIMLVFIESQSKFRSQRRAMAAVAVVEEKKGLRALQALKVVTRMEAKGSRHHAKKRHGPGLECSTKRRRLTNFLNACACFGIGVRNV